MTKPHRGRIQAQSDDFEASEPWAQDKPPTWEQGLEILNKLEQKIPKKERDKREKQFRKAEGVYQGNWEVRRSSRYER